ncbi:MAG: hypothetical protein WA061_01725 [Microgenomates group bacterium]
MDKPEVKIVLIPSRDEHEGFYSMAVKLYWVCTCGEKRGEPNWVRSYDGSRCMNVHGWVNPCGHVDKYYMVREEAKHNGLNEELFK